MEKILKLYDIPSGGAENIGTAGKMVFVASPIDQTSLTVELLVNPNLQDFSEKAGNQKIGFEHTEDTKRITIGVAGEVTHVIDDTVHKIQLVKIGNEPLNGFKTNFCEIKVRW